MSVPFLNVKPHAFKVKVAVRFPANVQGGVAIDVYKMSGTYTINWDLSKLVPTPVIADPLHSYFPYWNNITGIYNTISGTDLLAGASILPDAPWTLRGNPTAGVTFAVGFTIGSLASKPVPVGGDQLVIQDAVDGSLKNITLNNLSPVVSTPGTLLPLMDGVATVGVALRYSREDHKHPTDTTLAPLASPVLTGNPTAPTPAPGDADTSIATTAFVASAITTAAVPPATAAPLMDGVAAVGVALKYAREDHRHPTDTSREPTIAGGTVGQYWRGDKSFQTLDKTAVGLGNVDNTSDVNKPVSTAQAAALALKANIASPVFTGDPQAPTAAPGDNDTSVATTAFVTAAVTTATVPPATVAPLMDGVAAVGIATKYAREDHRHPTDTTLAPLASPTFTGDPKAPTAAPGDNDTSIATTAFVTAAVNAAGGVSPSNANPIMDSVAAPGSSALYSRADHVHPSDTSRSPYQAMADVGIQVNGGMAIDQEFTGAATTGLTGASKYAIDGWIFQNAGVSVVTMQQVTDAPVGYTNSLKISVTTANGAPGVNDYISVTTPLEGYRIARLAFGTASAAPLSFAFWVKAHRTGQYSGTVRNGSAARSYPFLYTINVADTWEFKTVTLNGDTTGTWPATNTVGMYIGFAMQAGANLLGTANAWAAAGLQGATGQINGAAATTDTFQITGLFVVPGVELPSSAVAPLVTRPADQELLLCQRYWRKFGGNVTQDMFFDGYSIGTNFLIATMHHYGMRAAPAWAVVGSWTISNCSPPAFAASPNVTTVSLSPLAAGRMYWFNGVGAYLSANARL